MIRFYMKKGRWKVTSDTKTVPANEWWAAINEVKCLNHKIRMRERQLRVNPSSAQTRQW